MSNYPTFIKYSIHLTNAGFPSPNQTKSATEFHFYLPLLVALLMKVKYNHQFARVTGKYFVMPLSYVVLVVDLHL